MAKHSHGCNHCKTPVECDGELQRNFDGWPETVCHAYHVEARLFLCESCERAFNDPGCHVCGGPSVMTVEDADDASGYRGDIALCELHYHERVVRS